MLITFMLTKIEKTNQVNLTKQRNWTKYSKNTPSILGETHNSQPLTLVTNKSNSQTITIWGVY